MRIIAYNDSERIAPQSESSAIFSRKTFDDCVDSFKTKWSSLLLRIPFLFLSNIYSFDLE